MAPHNPGSADARDRAMALLAELYGGGDVPIDAICDRLFQVIEEQRAARPEELRAYDGRTAPDWYDSSDTVAYVLYADLFCPDAAPGHILEALQGQHQLAYFTELGVNLLHILPIMSNSGDAGFAVDDFERVDPRFGTTADLQQLIRACHRQGLRIALDFVLNHVSTDHEWAMKARQGDPRYTDFFVWDERDPATAGEPWPGVPDIFPDFAPGHWDYVEEVGRWVWATFYKRRPRGSRQARSPFGQWDLNYRNPEVLLSMLRHLLRMANWGVDVFRLDAVPYLWKEYGTPCASLPQVHTILKLIRLALQSVAPHATLLAEANRPFEEIVAYFGQGDEVQVAYHFSLMPALWRAVTLGRPEDLDDIRATLDRSARPYWHWWVFSEVHDELTLEMVDDANARAMSRYFMAGGSPPFRQLADEDFPRGVSGTTFSLLRGDVRRILLLWQLQLSLGWTPLFYMGAELGVANDPAYQCDPERREDSRFVKRLALGEERKGRRHDPGSKEAYLFHNLRRLIAWRRGHSCLARPPAFFDTGSPRVIGYSKEDDRERMVLLANCADTQETVTVPGPDRATPRTRTLRPFEFAWEHWGADQG